MGLLLNHLVGFEKHWIAIILTVLISSLICLWHNNNFSVIKIQNLLVFASILVTGMFYSGGKNIRELPHFDRNEYYLAEVCQKPAAKAKSYQTILQLKGKNLLRHEKVVAYFSKMNFDSTITTGDQLIIIAKPQLIRNAGNPFEFDYQALMRQRDICFSVYLEQGTYLNTNNRINHISNLAEQVRDRLVAMLAKVLPNKEERSVVSALTLGYRTEIDQNTLDYFASTGAMHVLSVSGLHVALIFMILGFLLAFLKRGKTGMLVFSVVMISFLWIYAFITGFSPPVQRATVMFTFIIIGNGIRRPINIYNSLMASALFLILLNPTVIFDIGFQLSYLAIFGIIMIQPVLYNLFEVTNPLLKWCWSLFTVSVAAQITTFPLGLFYFNQFPNLFWLSNFVVIPITTLIIWLCLAFFLIVPFHGLATIIGIAIQKLTSIMLLSLKWMDAMPIALSKGIVLTSGQVWLLFGCLSAIIIFAYSKRKVWLFATLLLFASFQSIDFQEKRKIFNQKAVIVYNTKNLMIHLINGRSNYLIAQDYKNLTASEKSVFNNVCCHLRLAPTQQLNIEKFKSAAEDLQIERNSIIFINSNMKLNAQMNSDLKLNEIELNVFPVINKNHQVSKTICLGNLFPRSKQDSDIYRISTEGAFYCSLKSIKNAD
jgi:competence protein ComEC